MGRFHAPSSKSLKTDPAANAATTSRRERAISRRAGLAEILSSTMLAEAMKRAGTCKN